MGKVVMYRCDSCGTLHEPMDGVPFPERRYLNVGESYYCIECARNISVYGHVAGLYAKRTAEKENRS